MSTRMGRKAFDIETLIAIGARIRAARGDATQEDFASEIGVTRSALTNYEAGRRLPNDIILTNISGASGVPVTTLLFGATATPFATYRHRVDEVAMKALQERPGFIPKFMISDDEIAFISLFRWMNFDHLQGPLIQDVLDNAKEVISSGELPGGPPVQWGQGYVERLEEAVRRGALEEGIDPDFQFWTTFWEEAQTGRKPENEGDQ